jgi:hypothetical protein
VRVLFRRDTWEILQAEALPLLPEGGCIDLAPCATLVPLLDAAAALPV